MDLFPQLGPAIILKCPAT